MMRMFSFLSSELNEWFLHIIEWFPGRSGLWFRYHYWRTHLAQCGRRVHFFTGCKIKGRENIFLGSDISFAIYCQINAIGAGKEKITIGDNSHFNSNVMINAGLGGCIEIGKNCLIGPGVIFRTSNHVFSRRDIPIIEQGHKLGTIVLGDDVWIGANVSIIGNVTIGQGAIVGAGAVVVKDVADYAIVGGVPAKQIGIR